MIDFFWHIWALNRFNSESRHKSSSVGIFLFYHGLSFLLVCLFTQASGPKMETCLRCEMKGGTSGLDLSYFSDLSHSFDMVPISLESFLDVDIS